MDVLLTQAIFVAVLDKAFAGVDQEQALAPGAAFLVQHDDAGGNAGAVEQVGRKADDALDEALLENALTDCPLGTTTEQHSVG
ncbi:hypothetical protein D3C77_320290 [compost metagenome]